MKYLKHSILVLDFEWFNDDICLFSYGHYNVSGVFIGMIHFSCSIKV